MQLNETIYLNGFIDFYHIGMIRTNKSENNTKYRLIEKKYDSVGDRVNLTWIKIA